MLRSLIYTVSEETVPVIKPVPNGARNNQVCHFFHCSEKITTFVSAEYER
jgi:hypothetical protein